MKRFASLLGVCCLVLVTPSAAFAQRVPGIEFAWADKTDFVDENHVRLTGSVEIWQGGIKFNADAADIYNDTHRLIARGHVTIAQADSPTAPPTSSISAEAMDFNTESQTGTFYNAWGMASLGNRVDRSMFGTLEPDMYFYGETIEKTGRKKYRITNGGFTTCVQPVPRWQLTSGSVVISLEHYAILKNPVLRVKGVPLFYVPILYYPVKTKEDRATGILLPTIGTSSLRGFSVSNAFFWAINRSQDLTVLHDLFLRTGQGIGGEYRYVEAPGSQGDFAAYMLNEHEITELNPDGTATVTTPARRNYTIRGNANQVIGTHLRAGGRVSYFSDVVTQQTYNTNIYDATRSQRTISASLLGNFGGYRINGTFDRNEYFSGTTTSAITGSLPRVQFSRNELPIGTLPVYIRLGGEAVQLQRGSTLPGPDGTPVSTTDSLGRVEFAPTIRVPFTTVPFFTVNSSVTWHGTYWTRSWDASQKLLNEPVSRSLFELQSNLTGPIFSRIFDTPNSGYAEKLKHTIEPYVNIRRTTSVPNFQKIVQWESIDTLVGGTTITYGINNRVYAKRKVEGQQLTVSREILNVGLEESWYSNDVAYRYDLNYSSSFAGSKPFAFSPIAMTARALPTDSLNATFRGEWNTHYGLLSSISANGGYSGKSVTAQGGWTLARSISAQGLVVPGGLRNFLNGSATVRLLDNKYGGAYTFNFDAVNRDFVNQRFTAYYNMQCCGFAVDYQTFNFGNLFSSNAVGIPQDHRLNFSFTLAGLGSFSNFFGALSGAPR